MATRGTIAIQREDGTVAQVYSHWDNYLEGNGHLLVTHYNTPEKVEELLAQGDISSLGSSVGKQHPFSIFDAKDDADKAAQQEAEENDWTTFYGRDRGEKDTEARVYQDVAEYERTGDSGMFEEFNYFFIEGRWYYKSYDKLVRDVEKQLAYEMLKKVA
jgi:hypothetical protein